MPNPEPPSQPTSLTVDEAFSRAATHHQVGELRDAERLYRAILNAQPSHADALRNLSALVMQVAAGAFSAGQYEEAEAVAKTLIEDSPAHPFGWKVLGAVYAQTGRRVEALGPFRKAAGLLPDAEVHKNLGIILNGLGKFDAALVDFHRALKIGPDSAEVRNNIGDIFNRLGAFSDAMAHCRRALEINPDLVEAHNNLGNSLSALGRHDEATASYRRAIEIKPDFPEAHNNLAKSLINLGRLHDAIAGYRRALEIKPDYSEAHNNLGNVLRDISQLDAASAAYRRALEINPELHAAGWDLSLTLLTLGRYGEGWPHYESQFSLDDKRIVIEPGFAFPSWRGEPLVGRSIVIVEEQGIGDDLQFFRYASNLKAMGAAHVTLLCKDRMRPLFSRIKGVDSVVERRDAATVDPHDYWAYAQSLPLHCGTTVDTVPADVPYLFSDAALTGRVAAELDRSADLKIGICWRGNPAYKTDAERSPGLVPFTPIFGMEGVRVYTLLPNSRAELIANAGERGVDISHELDESTAPFEETAALIMNLDLVIACDTSIGHLAGALGKPVWLVIPYAAHWVWMTDREDSPWYPNTRLFRQTERGNWADVFERVTQKIRAVQAGEMPLVWPIK